MKFNWGTGLFIFFTIFICTLIFVLYQATQQDSSLVIDNYYEEDLNYQQHFDKKQNTADLIEKVKVSLHKEKDELNLLFPTDIHSKITGSVILYNPITKYYDQTFPIIKMEDNVFKIPLQIGFY